MGFENDLVNGFNRYFEETDDSREDEYRDGLAFRRRQAKGCSQVLDVLVDNPFIGVECKSVDFRKYKKLYFSSHFSDGQIERESEFLGRSGRSGFLAVELRRGRGRKKRFVGVPWTDLWFCYIHGKGVGLEDLPSKYVDDFVVTESLGELVGWMVSNI